MPFLWQVRDLRMKTSGPSQKREVILILSLWPDNGLWFSLAVKYRQGEFTKCLPSAQSYYDPNWIHTRLQQSCFMSNWLENNPHLFLPSGLYGDSRRQLIPEPTCNLPWPAPSQDLPLLPGKSTTLQNLSPYHTFEWSIPCMLFSLQSGLLKSRFALPRSKPVFLPWFVSVFILLAILLLDSCLICPIFLYPCMYTMDICFWCFYWHDLWKGRVDCSYVRI